MFVSSISMVVVRFGEWGASVYRARIGTPTGSRRRTPRGVLTGIRFLFAFSLYRLDMRF